MAVPSRDLHSTGTCRSAVDHSRGYTAVRMVWNCICLGWCHRPETYNLPAMRRCRALFNRWTASVVTCRPLHDHNSRRAWGWYDGHAVR